MQILAPAVLSTAFLTETPLEIKTHFINITREPSRKVKITPEHDLRAIIN